MSAYGEFGDCHLLGHAWDYTNSSWKPSVPGAIPVTLLCQRCGTERRESWGSHSGLLVARRYIHPSSYSLAKTLNGERPTRDDLRMWALVDPSVRGRTTRRR